MTTENQSSEQDPAANPYRKPARESFESFIERRIQEAMSEGAFQNLPGMGKPIPGIDCPTDENWWVRDKLKREQLNALPPILQAKLEVEKFLESLPCIPSEQEVRRRIQELNEQIREAHYSHQRGPSSGILPLDAEATVAKWKTARAAKQNP